MSGKLVVIEGTDGSGKATQTKKLYTRLTETNRQVRKVEYPNYESDSSALIKMYLNGDFGQDPEQVNTYAASTFYAVDRYASFIQEWQEFYQQGGLIIADRYTTSNMIHQAAKFDKLASKEEYLDWLWELEFDKFGLPVPDCVIFLDMPPENSSQLREAREDTDIHESNQEYLVESYQNACWIAEKYNWELVECVAGGQLKSIKQIHNQVYDLVQKKI